jgi:hypothetical protein
MMTGPFLEGTDTAERAIGLPTLSCISIVMLAPAGILSLYHKYSLPGIVWNWRVSAWVLTFWLLS